MTTNNSPIGRILVVDDEVELKNALVDALISQGYEAEGFSDPFAALKHLEAENYDLLLSDLMMADMDGIALLKSSLEIAPNLVTIIMTGHCTIQTAVDAMKLGAFDYVLKPFPKEPIHPLLSRAMAVRRIS